ncbi:MAG: methyltransferase [Anaerolineae bacterium]|nr:methyltransferase [Anaerolineae bacterium]
MIGQETTDIEALLLLETAELKPPDQVLIFGASIPLVEKVAQRVESVTVVDQSYSAWQRIAGKRIRGVTAAENVLPNTELRADVVLLIAPKGRDYARALLWSAYQSLRAGGKLYLAGANDGGVKSLFADAEMLFGRCVTLTTKQRHRIGVAVRKEASKDYPAAWGADPTQMISTEIKTPRGTVQIASMPGVFSWEHLDEGTRLLLESVQVAAGSTVLDVACGTGIIGVTLAQVADRVLMTDDNLLAVRCAEESVRLNGLSHVQVQAADVYEGVDGKFDLICSNPPFHQHFEVSTNVAQRIIREAGGLLNPGGRLCIVANAFLAYERVMAECFSSMQIIARNNRYVVIQGM